MGLNRWVGLANQCFPVAYQLKSDGSIKWAIATTYRNDLLQRLIAMACFNALFQWLVTIDALLYKLLGKSQPQLTKATTADTLVRQTIDAAKDWANLDGQAYLTLKRIHHRLPHV